VLIPEENSKDLQEIPENVKKGLEIVPVKWIDKVLDVALERHPTPLPEEEPAVAAAPIAPAGDGAKPAQPPASVKH
jgi:ATP-dependent Lon protease